MTAWARGVCAGVHAAGCRDVVYVPDNPLSHVLRHFEDQYRDVRLLLATREEEAFGIAAGLYLGGRKPAVLLQSSGLGNSLNAITSWPLIGWNAMSSASATIVLPSEHTRRREAGCVSFGSVFLRLSSDLRTRCSGMSAARRSFAALTATRSQNV